MVTQIIHIADLHIRAGDTAKSRYLEYELVMSRIVEDLSSYEYILNKQALIIIAGDIFHHKLKIESPGLKLSLQFIQGLAKLAEVFIIRGNHDYKQAYPDEPDLIESLLSIDIPNVTYLNKTGHYKVHNIGFGLVSIQDALFSGNTQGITPNLPTFPVSTFFDNDLTIQHKIALFHGPISKTKLPNGMEIMESHSYPLEWFKGYDSVMLGDIHLQQVNNSKRIPLNTTKFNFKHSIMIDNHLLTEKLTWAYPGSTVQQDFGETLLGHGFLIWDLPTRNIQCFHTCNDYGYVTVKKNNEIDWIVNMKTQFDNKWVSIEQIVTESWFPKNIFLRIKTFTKNHDFSISNEIYTLFQKYNINIIEIRQDYNGDKNILENNNDIIDESQENIDLASFNTPSVWIEYLQDKIIQQNTTDWKSWLINKEYLVLPSPINNVNKAILDKIQDKNTKFNKKLEEYQIDNDTQHNLFIIKKPFVFNYIQWDYILCYRDNNHFNFDNLDDNITSITAKNAQGKTSFLETICIALFGDGFPSRYNKTYSASIICQEKPPSANSKTVLHLTINNIKYIITRVFTTRACEINKIFCESKYTTLDKNENGNIINIHTGKTVVDTWVETYIGNIQSFLLSCMISQNVDMDFFSLKSIDQKQLLDNALCINASTKFHMLLKEAKLHHSSLIDTINTFIASFNHNNKFTDYPQKIINIKKDIVDNIKRKTHISDSYDNFNNTIRTTKLTNTSLFQLGKNILAEKLLEFNNEYDSISQLIYNYDINTIILEIGAYNNNLKIINVQNIITNYNKKNVDIEIINITAQISTLSKPTISFDNINVQINSYNQFKNKIYEDFINSQHIDTIYQDFIDSEHDKINKNDNIESINNYIILTKQNKNDNQLLITQSQNDINIYKQKWEELLKSQPLQNSTTNEEFEKYKNNIAALENKYTTYQQLISNFDNLPIIIKPVVNIDNDKYNTDISQYQSLKYLSDNISKEIDVMNDQISEYNIHLDSHQLEYNNTIKLQPLQSKNNNKQYLEWNTSFDLIKNKYTNLQDIQIKYNNIKEIQLPILSKINIDKELIKLNKLLSKFNINYDILDKQKEYSDICNKLQLLQSNIDEYNIKHINILTDKPIVSNEDHILLNEQYNKLNTIIQSSIISVDIQVVQNMISKVSEYIDSIKNNKNKINEYQQILNSIEDHPYNKECWACQKQPGKLHRDLINNTISDLNKLILQYTKKLTKYKSLDILQTHINNLNNFKDIEVKKQISDHYIQWKNNFNIIVKQLDSNKKLYITTNNISINLQNDIKQYENYNDIKIKIENYNKDINTWKIKIQNDIIISDFNIWNTIDYWKEDNEKHIQFKLWQNKIILLEQNITDTKSNIADINNKLQLITITKNNIENDILIIEWIKYNDYNQKYNDIIDDKNKWITLLDKKDFWIQEEIKNNNINIWKNDIINIEYKIQNEQKQYDIYNVSLQNLTTSLQTLQNLYKFKLDEKEWNDKLDILTLYKNTWNQIQVLEDELTLYNKLIDSWNIIDKINDSQIIINNIKRFNELQIILKDYQLSYELWDEWDFIENNYIFIKNIETIINAKQLEISLLQHDLDNHTDTLSILQIHKDYLSVLESRSEMLTSLYNEFAGFTNWLYNNKVIPSLVNSVNSIIKDICDNRPLFIQCTVNKPATGSISFDWFLKDGLSAPPIEKSSGFQKFIVGIAIRIALGTLGASGIKATQLFIDEGFTALDIDNLSKVNDFLDTLLKKYKHILIVSHLQDLNDCAKKHIIINRNINETTSQLQFGIKNTCGKPIKNNKQIDIKSVVTKLPTKSITPIIEINNNIVKKKIIVKKI